MAHAERQAIAEGKACGTRLTATLSGVPFYLSIGYHAGQTITIGLSNGEAVAAVEMFKDTRRSRASAGAPAFNLELQDQIAPRNQGGARRG
jgi:hypothetical protein